MDPYGKKPDGLPMAMDPLWTFYGPYMDPVWTPYGPPMDPLWTPYGPPYMAPMDPRMDPWTFQPRLSA